jgi:hypothetical protein
VFLLSLSFSFEKTVNDTITIVGDLAGVPEQFNKLMEALQRIENKSQIVEDALSALIPNTIKKFAGLFAGLKEYAGVAQLLRTTFLTKNSDSMAQELKRGDVDPRVMPI